MKYSPILRSAFIFSFSGQQDPCCSTEAASSEVWCVFTQEKRDKPLVLLIFLLSLYSSLPSLELCLFWFNWVSFLPPPSFTTLDLGLPPNFISPAVILCLPVSLPVSLPSSPYWTVFGTSIPLESHLGNELWDDVLLIQVSPFAGFPFASENRFGEHQAFLELYCCFRESLWFQTGFWTGQRRSSPKGQWKTGSI